MSPLAVEGPARAIVHPIDLARHDEIVLVQSLDLLGAQGDGRVTVPAQKSIRSRNLFAGNATRPGFSARAGPHRYSLAQAILPIGLPAAGGRRDCLDAVCKLHTCDQLWQLVVALESSPAILRRLGELEDHGERGLVRFVANSKLTQNQPLLGCPGADQMQRRGLGRTVKGAPQCLPVNRDGTQAGLGKAGSGSV